MKTGYDVSSLEQGIVKANANIKIFEDAINKEYQTIEEYKRMIEVLKRKKEEDIKKIEIK